jgi:hypothetical protein
MSCIIGYKKALSLPDRRPVVITLSIPPEAMTNVNRKTGILDRMFAKHRCDRCYITSIRDVETGEVYPRAISITPPRGTRPVVYYAGRIMFADRYDPVESNVCSHGIHFFLSYVRALAYKCPFRENCFQVWYDNGGVRYYGETFGKIFHGVFIEYDREGRILREAVVRHNLIQSCWIYDWTPCIRFSLATNGIVGRGNSYLKNREVMYDRVNIYLAIPALRKFSSSGP